MGPSHYSKPYTSLLFSKTSLIFSVFHLFRSLGGKPGSVALKKDKQNLIGISIGGGAPLCPCLYVVQVFDNTPAAKDGTLQAGDEIVGVNGKSMRGKTKVDVARAIQAIKVDLCSCQLLDPPIFGRLVL